LWIFRNSGDTSSPRATATGGAWVHAPPQTTLRKRVDLALASSLLPSLAGGDKQRHLRSKGNSTNKQFCSVLDLFKAFCSLFLLVCFFLLPMVDLVVAVVRGR
jgi:hypothetical protein